MLFFFFKQKTAYEMRISDWSSDVCSSDLQPLPSIELEIRREDGSCCAPGEHGEIHVRGEQVSGEYLHRKAVADDGWFATNDAGWLDQGGYLFVEGRLDDVIVRGGENIRSEEHTSELQSLMRISYAVFCLKKKTQP